MFLFLLFFWIAIFTLVAAVALPILRIFKIVDWEWKYILAPIWVPLVAISSLAFTWLVCLLLPILTLASIIHFATP